MTDRVPAVIAYRLALAEFGAFNPAIVTPAWLRSEHLLAGEDLDEATADLISLDDVVAFSFQDLSLEITYERLLLVMHGVPALARGRQFLGEIASRLPHTPVRELTMSWERQFDLGDRRALVDFFGRATPKDLWNDVLEDPIMQTIRVVGPRGDGFSGDVRIEIEGLNDDGAGLYVAVADEIELDATDGVFKMDSAERVIESIWDDCERDARRRMQALLPDWDGIDE